MASMTDYIVLSDGSFEIDSTPATGSPDSATLTFHLPDDFTVGTNLARPVLAFVLNMVSNEGSLGIWVNPALPLKQTERVHTLSWKNTHHADSGLWEAVQGTRFKKGQQNKIVFAMQAADKGRARFRDVILWFQRGSGA